MQNFLKVILCLVFPLITHAQPPHFWRVEELDSQGNVGYYTSISEGDGDCWFISYYDATNGDLKCCSGYYECEKVDSVGDVGRYTSIATSEEGFPHISYYDATKGDLKYALGTEKGWSIQHVDSSGNVGLYTSIARDTLGHTHISYYDSTNGDLKYAYVTGRKWKIDRLDSLGNVGMYSSIAIDDSNNVHISYYDATNGDLKYIYIGMKNFVITRVDTLGDVGKYSSVFTLDTLVYISYYDSTNGSLKLAIGGRTGWNIETVDQGPDVGKYTSICLDSYSSPYISYYANGALLLAYQNPKGDWEFFDCDTSGDDVGRYNSAIIYMCGWLAISYYDATNGNLKVGYDSNPVEEEPFKTPLAVFLGQNSPNPTRGRMTILYEIPKDSWVSLELFNVAGQLMATLINEYQTADRHYVIYDSETLMNGIYFYTLKTNGTHTTKKLLVIR